MTEKPSDDIFALCSRFDLDQENYRVFPKNLPTSRSSDYSDLASEALPEKEPDSDSTAQASRTALRNLWRHVELSESKEGIISFHELLAASVFVYGTAGGAGATTIAATLARLLAKAGRRCALIDERDESVLPFFFGNQQAIYDARRYPGLHAASEMAVRIITKGTSDPDNSTQPNCDAENSWLQRSVFPFQSGLDHLIVDVRRGQEPSLSADATPIAVLTAVPDVSSLVGARALKRILREKASGVQMVCVLNKFDSSQALHLEIRGWFEENFDRVVTLSRSDLLNEALAEGLTVVDWRPQSEPTADFLRLTKTIQDLMPAWVRAQQKGGSPLCS